MQTKYLYDMNGNWIAFSEGKYLFNTDCQWIGWFPQEDIAVDLNGNYLGTIYNSNRLLMNLDQHQYTKQLQIHFFLEIHPNYLWH